MLAVILILILYLTSSLILPFIPVLSDLSLLEKCLIFLAIALRALFGIMTPALIVSNKSAYLATSIIIQSFVNFIVVIFGLFYLDLGRSSLILGNTSGVMASVLFSMKALNLIGLKKIRLKWFYLIKRIGVFSTISGLCESARLVLENAIISTHFGNLTLGIYTHARSYQAILLQATNAVASVSWPISLEEARRGDSKFLNTTRIWDIVYLLLTYVGVLSVFFGEIFIVILTNEKFRDAGTWLPFLVVYVLIQNFSKPATAILFNEKKANIYSNVRTLILFFAMLLLIFLVPLYGVKSVIFIAIGEILLSRIIFTVIANRIQKTSYRGYLAIFGCFLILGSYCLSSLLVKTLSDRIIFICFFTAATVVIVYNKVKIMK
jgi:O-antigen/teichoic acid export membrane protein